MSNRMTEAEIRKQLLNLERRALHNGLDQHGGTVIMYSTELDALDEAIKLLDPELHPEAVKCYQPNCSSRDFGADQCTRQDGKKCTHKA